MKKSALLSGLSSLWRLLCLRWLAFDGRVASCGAEERVEWLYQVGVGFPAWVDPDLGEEGLVEHAFEVVGGFPVGAAAVLGEVERGGQVFRDGFVVGGGRVEFACDGGQFSADSLLFAFEQVEGDGVGVVGLQKLLLFPGELVLGLGEGSEAVALFLIGGRDFFEDEGLDRVPIVGGQADPVVEGLDFLFDLVDEDGFHVAVGDFAFAAAADEVGVDGAGLRAGVVDEHAVSAGTADDLGRGRRVGSV